MCVVGLPCRVLSLGCRNSGTVDPTYVVVAFLVWFCRGMDEEDSVLWLMMPPRLLELVVVALLFVVDGKLQ